MEEHTNSHGRLTSWLAVLALAIGAFPADS
jgi:hypothetical protein